MSSNQILLFEQVDFSQLQSYISEIQKIKNADYGDFDALQIQEYSNALEGVSASQAAFLLSTQGLTKAQIAETLVAKEGSTEKAYQAMIEAGLLKSKQSLTNTELQKTIATKIGNEEDAKALMSHMGLAVAIEGEEAQTVQLTAKKLQQAVASGLLTEAQAQEIAMTTGVTVAQNKQVATTMPKWIASMKAMALATWEQVKATAAWLATTPTGWATLAIGGIVGITAAIKHNKKEAEEARQKIHDLGETARSEIDSINSEFESTKSTVDNVAERYATLAQEVQNLGKANQSQGTLSNDEYSEFLDISNQLSELFPRLTTGYDDNGNAILNLSGNVNTITSSLYDLVEAEKAAASIDIQERMDDIWGDYSLDVEDYSKKYNKAIETQKKVSDFYQEIISGEGLLPTSPYAEIIYEQAGMGLSDVSSKSWDSLSETQQNNIKEAYADLMKLYKEDMRIASEEIKSANKDFSSYLISSLQGTDYYEELGEYKSIVNSLLSNYGYDTELYKLRGSENWDKALTQVKNELINPFKSLSEEDKKLFQEYYNNLLSIDTEAALADNIPKIEEYTSKLAKLLGIDENEFRIALNYNLDEDKQLIDTAKKRMGYIAEPKSLSDVNKNKMINDVVDSLEKTDVKLLTEVGISEESKKWTKEEWLDFIEELRNDPNADISINPTAPLNSIKDAFSRLDSIYEDIHNGTSVSADSIESLNEAFGELDGGAALKEFKDVVTTMPDDIDAQQEALDKLVTSYIDESGILDDLSEENKNYIIQELEKIHVTNAEEVVESRLNNSVKKNIKSFKEFSSVLSEHLDTLKNADPASDEFKKSLETVKTSFEDFLKANFGDEELELPLSDDFIIQNLEDIEAAASGSEEAINRVRIAASKDIAANINLNVPPQDYAGTLNQINSWIDNADIGNLEVGTYLDDTPLIQGLNHLVDAGTITRDNMNAILSGIDVFPDTSYEPVSVTLPNGTLGGASIGMATATLQIPRIRYKIGSNGAKAHYSAPISTSSGSGGGSGGGGSSDSDNEFNEQIDWIETNLQRLEEELDRLDKKSSNVYSLWSNRNTALNEQIAKTREEIILQQKAYDGYMAKANSIGLSDAYVSKVQNGTIQIEDITDENLANKISEYQTWYEKAIQCKDAIQGLNISLGDLADQKFENLETEYDNEIAIFESLGSLVDETINRTEEHGYFVAKKYYKQLIDYENQKLNELQQQYAALIQSRNEALRSGAITENSQEWYNMTQSILDKEKAIEQSTTSRVKFNNEIRDLDWEIFDYIEERINQITQESDYLIKLLDNENLYTDTGSLTSEGKASAALHGINYNTYMQQALDYAKELKDIEQEISKDSANKDLIERREELLELQQDAITNAEAEKDAIKSLVEEGINIHLDSLNSLIDKYKDAMNSAKDLYDYQKNISSQIKDISNLEKQILAYEGDDSEEARKIIQETKLSLEEARTELKETEWDKYISETEQLLDTLYDDYEEVLNARFDNIDALVSDMIDMVNSNGSEIRNTIESVAKEVGYNITGTLSTALGEGSKLNLLISDFSSKFDTNSALQSSIDAIKAYVYEMINEGKNKVASETTTHDNPNSSNSSNPSTSSNNTHNSNGTDVKPTPSSNSSNPSSAAPSSSGDGMAKVGDAVIFATGKYHEDSWGNGKSGNQLLGEIVYITKIAPNSPYPYHISRTSKFGEANLGWVKLNQLNGYSKGSKRINKEQLAWTQENGNEILYRSKDGALLTPFSSGDMVFTNEMTQRLWEMAKGNIAMIPNVSLNIPKTNDNSGNKTINNDNNISITLPNVKNYDEFKSELQKDTKFVGFVQEVTLGEALGHNSLRKNKF